MVEVEVIVVGEFLVWVYDVLVVCYGVVREVEVFE